MFAAWLRCAAAVSCTLSFVASIAADDGFYLKDGDRVVFYGDSITAGGGYVRNVAAYLLTRFPDKKIEVINHGISSETISGTSETDHTPRRPWALERFDRDIKSWKPTVVVACFGMNDGNYHPFDEARFEKYQAGIRTLIRRVRNECGARLTIMTPPTYDAYQRKNGDPQAQEFGYKFAYIGYDETLAKYAAWLMTLREPNVLVVDLHTAMSEHLAARRKSQVSFTMQPDAVHPNATGHFLMAHTLLKAWHGEDEMKPVRVEAIGTHEFRLQVVVPRPIDAAVDAESRRIVSASDTSGRLIFTAKGLKPGRYRVAEQSVEGGAARTADLGLPRELGNFSAETLAQGVDLAELPAFSGSVIAEEALKHVNQSQQAVYGAWRKSIAAGEDGLATAPAANDATADGLRVRCRPYVVRLTLAPIDE